MTNLRDVAKEAGVSIATASRVINNSTNVKPDNVAKVKNAIKKLNYRPNRVAQRLRSKEGNRKLLGLLIPDIQNPFYTEVIRGVEKVAHDNNYVILMGNFGQEKEKYNIYLDLMLSESVDGLILGPTNEKNQQIYDLIKRKFPIVCIDRGLDDIESDVVLVDNEHGAYIAVKTLIESGHKKIAYIAGLPSIPTTIQRKDGYEKALREHNIPINDDYIVFGDSKRDSGKNIVKELFALENPPTALFTGNNLITLGALEQIHKMNLKIPDDVAIIGFDDMPWSNSLNPPLTAISQPGYEIGKRAANMMINRIMNPERATAQVILKTKLIKRKSC